MYSDERAGFFIPRGAIVPSSPQRRDIFLFSFLPLPFSLSLLDPGTGFPRLFLAVAY